MKAELVETARTLWRGAAAYRWRLGLGFLVTCAVFLPFERQGSGPATLTLVAVAAAGIATTIILPAPATSFGALSSRRLAGFLVVGVAGLALAIAIGLGVLLACDQLFGPMAAYVASTVAMLAMTYCTGALTGVVALSVVQDARRRSASSQG